MLQRPFLLAKDVARTGAGILRFNPTSIKWTKDRGKEPVRPKEDFPWFWSWDEKTTDFQGGPDFDGNRVNGYFFLVRDVSQRYQAEVALKQANELLDRSLNLYMRIERLDLIDAVGKQDGHSVWCRISGGANDDKIVVHHVKPLDAVARRDKSLFGRLGVDKQAVGDMANTLKIKIVACQLGCF